MARVKFDPKSAGLWTTQETYVRRRFNRLAERAVRGDLRALREAKKMHEAMPALNLIPSR
jgi:hypothetical protein